MERMLAGVVLVAICLPQLVAPADVVPLPAIAPYARLGPVDSGYPDNIPADLPASLPPAPPVLRLGKQSPCDATVADVLRAQGRLRMLSLMQMSPMGRQVLTGAYEATVLAPTDEAIAALGITPAAVLANPLLVSTFADYHVIQGRRLVSGFSIVAGNLGFRGYNTTMSQAYCPTANQLVNVMKGGAFGTKATDIFLQSGQTTAKVVTGDLAACNSIVHLVDAVLQPCCTSLYEMVGQFSIVQITPSYFDGYKPQAPPENTDDFNRRLFEEQLLDMLLLMTKRNATRTILWPAPSAWTNVKLAKLLPSVDLTRIDNRVRAMKILALYMLSYQEVLLPKDTKATSMTSANLPFLSALRNGTSLRIWNCSDSLTLMGSGSAIQDDKIALNAAVGEAGAFVIGQQATSAPASVPAPAAVGGAAPAGTPTVTPTPAVTPAPPAATPPVATPAPKTPAPATTVPTLVAPSTPATPASTPANPAKRRRQLLQATGAEKSVRIVDTYETCEGFRVLIVDQVAVPCDYEILVKAAKLVDAQVAAFAYTGLPDSYYTNLRFQQMAGEENNTTSPERSAASRLCNSWPKQLLAAAASIAAMHAMVGR